MENGENYGKGTWIAIFVEGVVAMTPSVSVLNSILGALQKAAHDEARSWYNHQKWLPRMKRDRLAMDQTIHA